MNRFFKCLLLAGVLTSPPAFSSGIPTVDVVAIAEAVRQSVQQLKNYQTLISQLDTQNNQYTQMLKDFDQEIKEYNLLLKRVADLKLSAATLAIFDEIATVTYGGDGIGQAVLINPTSSNAEADTETVLRQHGQLPQERTAYVNQLEALGLDKTTAAQAQYDEIYLRSAGYRNQIKMTQQNERNQNTTFNKKIRESKAMTRNLGPESDLATLQNISNQQIILMEQIQEMTRVQNQQLLTYESPTQAANVRRIRGLEAEVRKFQRLQARQKAEKPLPKMAGHAEILK